MQGRRVDEALLRDFSEFRLDERSEGGKHDTHTHCLALKHRLSHTNKLDMH